MPIDYDYDKLFNMLESITMRQRKQKDNTNRNGFPDYRGQIYGKVNARFKGWRDLSKDSIENPEIYAELKKLGDAIVPFDYTSIQIARNLVSPRHLDRSNVGVSCLVSLGSYAGQSGFIYIDGKKFNAYKNPLIFDGSKLEHWNTPITSGVKYSLIYFRC